jgi:hypothetical protein
MKALLRGASFVLCVGAAACAVVPRSPEEGGQRAGMSAQSANDAVAAGSTQADVAAALGNATVVHFDSGFEVWVYRYRSEAPGLAAGKKTPGNFEFVLLFDPAGKLAKKRIRVPPPAD